MKTSDNGLRAEMWPIDRLRPNPRNARVHSEFQIAELAASVREFGFVRPITADENAMVLTGHATLRAARQIGLKEVPVIVIDHFSETQKRAYPIADNQLPMNSAWDDGKLGPELAALERELFDTKILGFSPEELDRLAFDLPPEIQPIDEDFVSEEPPPPVSVTGDLWMLGAHRVLCGDALLSEALTKILNGPSADMVFTDPPYNVSYQQRQRHQGGSREIANDNLGAEFEPFLRTACERFLPVTKGAVYICMSSSQLPALHRAFISAGGYWSDYLIWDKGHFSLGRSNYQRQYEPILYGWPEGQDHYWCGSRDQGDVWQIPKPQTNRLHPTMKPVALIERAIRNSSGRGDMVLDPFGGSGSSVIACEKTGRRARVVELLPQYVDVIIRRWEDYTGRDARRESDGLSFKDLLQQRSLVEA